MRKVLFAVAVAGWGFLVFAGTFYATFPSQAIGDRIRYEVPRMMGDEYTVELGSVSPWWMGLSVSDVKLYRADDSRRPAIVEDEEGEEGAEAPASGSQLVGLFENVRVRVSPWSLLRRAPYLSGVLSLPGGDVDFSVGTAVAEEGDIGLADVVVRAEALPLEDLLMLAPKWTASGTGSVDIDIDLHAGSNGMRDATGKIAIVGSNLELTDVELPTVGNLGMPIPIAELLLQADVVDGKATFTDAHANSELAKLTLGGELTLRDPIDRSAMDIQLTVSDIGESLGPMKNMATAAMADARQADGSYLYSCRGVIARLSPYACSAGDRKISGAGPRAGRPGAPGAATSPREVDSDNADPDREKRREEIRERLRQRREEREAQRASGTTGRPTAPVPEAEETEEGEEEEVIEEGEDPGDDPGGEEPEDVNLEE
jgi:type II secretion system protein N